MSLSPGIQGLKNAVGRLKAAAGSDQRHCPYYRFTLARPLPDPKEPWPKPEDVLIKKCEFCLTEYRVRLTGVTDEEREVERLMNSFTMRDEYTNPTAHALDLWHELRRVPGGEGESARPPPGRRERPQNSAG